MSYRHHVNETVTVKRATTTFSGMLRKFGETYLIEVSSNGGMTVYKHLESSDMISFEKKYFTYLKNLLPRLLR